MKKYIKLPAELKLQLYNFLIFQMNRCLTRYEDKKLKENVRQNFRWIKKFSELHYLSRIQRAKELTSPEVAETQKLAKNYIGKNNHDYFVTCVDGRNMPTVMFSKPPHVGGVLRTPAGTVNGFMEGQKKDKVFIDKKSYVVQQIISLLRKKTGDTIYYGLDSHLGCAARGQIHSTEGGQQKDGGTRSDILSKITTAKGILQLRNELWKAGEKVAEIVPIFFSFDPLTGGVISGLEMHVNQEEVARKGYTAQVIDDLVKKGKILRIVDILKNDKIVNLLNKEVVPGEADFRNQYQKYLLKNWQTIIKLYNNGRGEIFTYILDKLTRAYLSSGWKKNISDKTLKQKAKFLLKNLVTRYSIAGAGKKWPYNLHQEEMIVITEGGYAPFPALDAFAVFSQDLEGLTGNIKITIDLILDFRVAGKIKNPVEAVSFSKENFSSAPILVSNKSIFRNFQEKSWGSIKSLQLDNMFSHIDWDDPETLNWDKTAIQKFIFNTVKEKAVLIEFDDALRFIDGIYELFNRMRLMMSDKSFRRMIIHGNIVILNTLVDQNRMPKYIVPFAV